MTNAGNASPNSAEMAAPLSFLGMDWLFLLNMTLAALGVLVFSYVARVTIAAWWRDRHLDARGSAPELMRRIFALFTAGATLRALSDMIALYGWNPEEASSGGWAVAGRFLDPMGFMLMLAAGVIWLLTKKGLVGQLRTPPPFQPLWEGWDMRRRLLLFAIAAFALALCPVIFR